MTDNKRILIVDDDEEIRFILGEYLKLQGHDFETASDGIEALAKVKLDVDLVLMDVNMPKMDGYEVIKRIRAEPEHRDLPIIMVTAMASREESPPEQTILSLNPSIRLNWKSGRSHC